MYLVIASAGRDRSTVPELAGSGAVDRALPAEAITRYKLDLPVSEGL